ncbi:MAG TPA: signal peptidase II [Thermoanaerobaculia bacterium]|nr:signal peptidase II [Thermoanaerobaculia bacterium]
MVVGTVDLVHKALAISASGGAVFVHERSALYVAGVAAASVLWAGAIARLESASIALAGGLVLGGAFGNLASIALWPSLAGVPDPIVAGGFAFNMADVAVGLGVVLLFPTSVVFAVRSRARLSEPV